MITWLDHRLLDLLGIQLPIILLPMAGPGTAALAIVVAEACGLGSLACALLSPDQARAEFVSVGRGGPARNERGNRIGSRRPMVRWFSFADLEGSLAGSIEREEMLSCTSPTDLALLSTRRWTTPLPRR
jgi:hypothetical protein